MKAHWWCMVPTSIAPLQKEIAAFNKDYPWAKVQYDVDTVANLYTKVVAESESGKYVDDVLGATPGLIVSLENGNFVVNYTNPMWNAMGVPKSSLLLPGSSPVDVEYYWDCLQHESRHRCRSAEKLDRFLGSPIWKGKIAMDSPNRLQAAGIVLSSLETVMGNASWTTLMQQIAANDPTLYSSGYEFAKRPDQWSSVYLNRDST